MRKTDNFALLMVDLQVDFCSPEGFAAKLGRNLEPIKLMLPKLKQFYREIKKLDIPVIFAQYVARKDLSPKNIKINRDREEKARMCLYNSSGANIYYFRPKEPDIVIKHSFYDAFANTSLSKVLYRKGINTLIIAGVRTELSVDATAKRAISEGLEVVLPSDLVSTYQEKLSLQKQFLELFNRYYGNVKKSEEILIDLQDQYL